ncbi:purple acid phosphatase 2-like [Camellia sinensis]|uniref:purple acid phosphatase 2-like n=1 Tax=Camellia sinensis TaxID=4442 RepID=UPI0010355700|nr:purple acid phosphatase 2-like [Camellia sinensis]
MAIDHVCINYASGYIHHATIKDLTFDTKYFYEVASNEVTRQFSFTTPPKPGPDVSYTFGVIGDLGQTADSNRTLEHYMSNPIKGQAVLFAGDLSYADDHPNHDNTKWDTFGRFIEKSVAYQPWIWSAGNHEIDLASNLEETDPFKPYLHRYYVPYKASQSTSPFWYSIKRASTYIIVLSSYSAYDCRALELPSCLPSVSFRGRPIMERKVLVCLQDPVSRLWPVIYHEKQGIKVLASGWEAFCKANRIQVGDECAFEIEDVSECIYKVNVDRK